MSKGLSSVLSSKISAKIPINSSKGSEIRSLVESVFFQPTPTLDSANELDNLSLAVISFKDWGPDPICYENLKWESQPDAFLTKLGVYYMTIIGQGCDYHHGLYGPIPVHTHPDQEAYLFGFTVHDDSVKDKRAKKTAYSALLILFPKNLKPILHSCVETINKLLSREIADIKDITQLTSATLAEIKAILKEGIFYHNTLSTLAVS
ncbi:MAG: hypothetical protein ACFFBD_28195 [Candidatus Hodarchaeota archaeon]